MQRKMKEKITLGAGILLLLFLGLTAFGQGNRDKQNYLITADSAGDVRLGMTIAAAGNLLPGANLSPDTAGANLARFESGYLPISVTRGDKLVMSLMTEKYNEAGDEIPLSDNAKIIAIKIWDSNYRTADGVYPGMTITDAEKIYGKITEIFGFYGADETLEFSNQPKGFDFLGAGKGQNAAGNRNSAGLYINGGVESAYKYNPGAYILSISVSGY